MALTTAPPSAIGTDLYDAIGSINDGLTATASGTQATSQVLLSQFNRFSVVATTADSAKLPQAVFTPATLSTIGSQIWVMNSGANAMQIFGSTPDTINGVATATGVSVPAGKAAVFTLVSIISGVGAWYMLLGA